MDKVIEVEQDKYHLISLWNPAPETVRWMMRQPWYARFQSQWELNRLSLRYRGLDREQAQLAQHQELAKWATKHHVHDLVYHDRCLHVRIPHTAATTMLLLQLG
jgi:hypothetical protein